MWSIAIWRLSGTPALFNSWERPCTPWTTPVSSTISSLWLNPICFRNLFQMSSVRRGGRCPRSHTALGRLIQVTTLLWLLVDAHILTYITPRPLGKGKSRPSTYTIIEPATPTPQQLGPVPALRLPARRVDFIGTENDGPHCVPSLSAPATTTTPAPPVNDVPPPIDACMRSCGAALPPRPPSPVGTNPFLPKRPSSVHVTNPFPTAHGQPHGLRLDKLGLDEVIAILKATASGIDGRAKWFTAGSDYYRLKDFPAAIAVLTAMVEGGCTVLSVPFYALPSSFYSK